MELVGGEGELEGFWGRVGKEVGEERAVQGDGGCGGSVEVVEGARKEAGGQEGEAREKRREAKHKEAPKQFHGSLELA